VTRALEKLKTMFMRRGLTFSTSSLATLLAGQAVIAAPAGLTVSVTGAALAGAATGSGITFTLLKVMTMTKLKTGIVGALVVAGVATPLVIQHQAQVKLSKRDEALQRQTNHMAQLTAEDQGQKIVPQTYSAETLANMIRRRGKLPVGECVDLALKLTSALEFLHQKRLIHRDIKPSNIIFVNGSPKFADVGLVTEIESKPRAATYLGTEGYIAPEGPGTPAADVFSLGKVLYEASMGKDRLQFPDLPTAVFEGADPLLPKLNEIILKACEENPQARYQSAAQMHQDLSTFAAK
jgi:serine/threonine protein kinase